MLQLLEDQGVITRSGHLQVGGTRDRSNLNGAEGLEPCRKGDLNMYTPEDLEKARSEGTSRA